MSSREPHPPADVSSNGGSGRSEATAVPAGRRLERLAVWCVDHRRRVLGIWVLAMVVAIGAGSAVGSQFTDQFSGGNSESAKAQDLLHDRFPARAGTSVDIVFHTRQPLTDPAVQARVAKIGKEVAAKPGVSGVVLPDPANPAAAARLSRDGHIGYATVQFSAEIGKIDKQQVRTVVDAARSFDRPGFQVELGGQAVGLVEPQDFGSSEGIGLLAAVIILLFAFGSLIAMGLPIMTAVFGLGVSVGLLDLISHILTVPTFAPQMAAMIGLGVGIDYALFIVTRHRETLHRGADPRASAVVALSTAGRAVVFAGCTVVISLLGMLLLGLPFIYGLAAGAIAAVVLVMLGALTLLPAMLGFSGTTIDRFGISRFLHRGEGDKKTLSYRWSRLVQHHSWLFAGAALLILLVMAIPLFSMQQSFTDAGNNPTSLTTRRAYDLLSQGFGPGTNGPLIVAVAVPKGADDQVVERLSSRIGSTPGVAFAAPPQFNQARDAATIFVVPETSPQDPATQTLVHHIRSDVVRPVLAGTGVTGYVGGITAGSVDASNHLSTRLPYVIGGVIILSFLLLMAVFRSIAVPIKAAIVNLLSIGAAYGVIVAVFQWGWLSSVFGVAKTGPIDPWIPLMLFTILFGLSMDYEVFLLSRIREEWLRTGDNETSVADGLAGTARVITAAAAIMVCVFGSFVLGDIRVLKVFGLGLASAVFIDATIVRMVLVPATMELLGDRNWWFPSWLDRLVPDPGIEGPQGSPTPPAPSPEESRQPVGA